MKGIILDPQVKVYSSMDDNSVSMATLEQGSEIEYGTPKRKSGKVWVPILLQTGQTVYIPGEARVFTVRLGELMDENVDLYDAPSSTGTVKQQLPRNTKISILQVVKDEGVDWVRVKSLDGTEGYISGNTRIRLVQQRTKAGARRNLLTGAMWVIAGAVIAFSQNTSSSSSFILLGYGAILFGAVLLISGLVQYFTAKA